MFWQKFKEWLSIDMDRISFCVVWTIKYIFILICIIIVWEKFKKWLSVDLNRINFSRIRPMKYILKLSHKFKEWLSIGLYPIKSFRLRPIVLLNELPTSHIRKKKNVSSSLVLLESTLTNKELQHPLITVLNFKPEIGRYGFRSVKLAQLPIETLRSITANFKCKAVPTEQLVSFLPLVFIPSLKLRKQKFHFEFMDEKQDYSTVIQEKEDGLSAENYVIDDDSQFCWKKQKYDSSSVPRIAPEVIYVKEEECFVVFGGFVPTKFLPNECINDFCTEILTKRSDLSTRKIIKESYYPINDLWKFHIKDSRWELLSPPGCLVQYDTGRWDYLHLEPFGSICYSFHCPLQKKIYFLTAGEESSEVWEYNYLTNEFELIADIDLERDHYSNRTPPLVDDSNNTVIFLGDLLQKVLVVCLETFECLEIQLEQRTHPEILLSEWNMIFDETGKTLILIRGPDQKSDHKGETIRFTFSVCFVDWEKIKRNKITPFLKRHRDADNAEN